MARDLLREVRPAVNGDEPHVELPPDDRESALSPESRRRVEDVEHAILMMARRDHWITKMMVLVNDTAKLLEPLTRIVVARILTIGALGAAVGMTAYAVALAHEWERVVILVAFLGLCGIVIRRGQPKAPTEPSR